MSTIEDLEAKVKSLNDQLKCAQASLNEAKLAACPIKVGEVYTKKDWRGGKITGQVSRITIRFNSVIPVLTLFKADGSLGKRESEMRWLNDWKLVSRSDGA